MENPNPSDKRNSKPHCSKQINDNKILLLFKPSIIFVRIKTSWYYESKLPF